MLANNFSELALYIVFYGFVGWIFETACVSIRDRRFVNRGFLEGPFCPVYGIGAVLVLAVSIPLADNWVLVAFSGVFVTFAMWTFSSWFSYKVFQWRPIVFWWKIPMHQWLVWTLLAGVLSLSGTYLLHPFTRGLIGLLQPRYQRVLASVLIVFFVVDFLYSLGMATGLGERLKKLKSYLSELEHCVQGTSWLDTKDLPGSVERLRGLCASESEYSQAGEILAELDALLGKQDHSLRLLRAYPRGLGDTWEGLLDYWEKNRPSLKNRTKSMAANFGRRTKTAVCEINPFRADGIGFYKLVWIFVIGSVIGYFVETLWCLVRSGVIESRQGMIYGPFNQVYGFGAVLMVLLLRPFAKRNDRWLFFGGALVGGGFEWVCSWLQEKVFGTVSWEYTGHVFSIGGGRTSLLYMFFWGILGVLFMKSIYPRISSVISKIPRRAGIFFSWVFIVALSANMLLSALAVGRWSARVGGEPPRNAVEQFLDENYPDGMLKEIYPNMQWVDR